MSIVVVGNRYFREPEEKMKLVLLLIVLAAAQAYRQLPRAAALRKTMSARAIDVSTLQTAVEVVTKPDGWCTYLLSRLFS